MSCHVPDRTFSLEEVPGEDGSGEGDRPDDRESCPGGAESACACRVGEAGDGPGEDCGGCGESGDREAGGAEGGEQGGEERCEGGGGECGPVAEAEVGVGG